MKTPKLVVSLLAMTVHAHLPNRLADNSSLSSLARRWHSVDTRVGMSLPAPYNFAWPVTCSSPKVLQPIRYCFRNARSARNLQPIIEGAIRIWAPGMAVSSMSIIQDPDCDDQDACICTQHGAAPDSLVIYDTTKDGDEEWNQSEDCITETTIGYDYIPRGEEDRPWRHSLHFCHHMSDLMNIRNMAHELGHAMGLLHEHQRKDRDQFLIFQPHNLQNYQELRELVEEDPHKLFPEDMSVRRRLWKVFDEAKYAIEYFPIMIDFVKNDQFKGTEEEDRAEAAKFSVDFDYESIMMYDSWMGSDGGPDDPPDQGVFKRRDNGECVWTGGSRDGVDAKITEGDIARIAQLYDNRTPECRAAKQGEHGWGTGMRVRIRDGEWLHVDPPNRSNFTKRDEL